MVDDEQLLLIDHLRYNQHNQEVNQLILETVCLSMYSDISKRTIASSEPKKYVAKAFVSSVLPTPVGPKK